MFVRSSAISLVLITALSGCLGDPRSFETEPVQVKTKKGVVTCQLYTHRQVLWDRAIDRPDKMTVQEADDVCRAEGKRRLKQSS